MQLRDFMKPSQTTIVVWPTIHDTAQFDLLGLTPRYEYMKDIAELDSAVSLISGSRIRISPQNQNVLKKYLCLAIRDLRYSWFVPQKLWWKILWLDWFRFLITVQAKCYCSNMKFSKSMLCLQYGCCLLQSHCYVYGLRLKMGNQKS